MSANKKTSVRGADNASKARYFEMNEGSGQVRGSSEPSPVVAVRAPVQVGVDKHGRVVRRTVNIGEPVKGTRVVRAESASHAQALHKTGLFKECDKPS